MTCRHAKGDPNCSSSANYYYRNDPTPATPDAANYSIEDVERVGPHVVLKVRYPNCRSCSYEGCKVMVFLNVTEGQLVKWRKVDPHFQDPKKTRPAGEAPSPAARFPGSAEGWADAMAYAKYKVSGDYRI